VHTAFLCLRFRFVLYWRKPTGAKAARRTLVKLTPGDDKRNERKNEISNTSSYFIEMIKLFSSFEESQ
jgi:hypothetical protein